MRRDITKNTHIVLYFTLLVFNTVNAQPLYKKFRVLTTVLDLTLPIPLSEYVAVIFCDLDNFKPINDNFGHTAGDLALKKCSEYFTSVVRAEDTVARYGGDEFIIVLGGLQASDDFSAITQKITNITKIPFEIDGHEITLQMSAGISFYPLDADDGETLIQNADTAMYKAKKAGKNQIAFFNEEHRC